MGQAWQPVRGWKTKDWGGHWLSLCDSHTVGDRIRFPIILPPPTQDANSETVCLWLLCGWLCPWCPGRLPAAGKGVPTSSLLPRSRRPPASRSAAPPRQGKIQHPPHLARHTPWCRKPWPAGGPGAPSTTKQDLAVRPGFSALSTSPGWLFSRCRTQLSVREPDAKVTSCLVACDPMVKTQTPTSYSLSD